MKTDSKTEKKLNYNFPQYSTLPQYQMCKISAHT